MINSLHAGAGANAETIFAREQTETRMRGRSCMGHALLVPESSAVVLGVGGQYFRQFAAGVQKLIVELVAELL